MTKARNPHWRSPLDEFLDREGAREVYRAVAIQEALACQKEATKA